MREQQSRPLFLLDKWIKRIRCEEWNLPADAQYERETALQIFTQISIHNQRDQHKCGTKHIEQNGAIERQGL